MSSFESAIEGKETILAEGAVIERLRRGGANLNEHVLAAALVLEEGGRERLRAIYDSYLEVAAQTDLPIVVLAPTWRAGVWMCEKAGLEMKTVNAECVSFIREVAGRYPGLLGRVFIGGVIGCRGDAYRPEEGLPRETARSYHAPQIKALQKSGVDFIMASTIPSIEEGSGIVMAAADVGARLAMSYVARSEGKVLDGTFLGDAVARIDSLDCEPPLFHMCNCIHPANFARALGRDENAPLVDSGRLIGLQANASMLDPEDLDDREELDSDDPVRWAGVMAALKNGFGIRLLGGCCGTDERHIGRLAQFLADQ